MIGYYAHHQGAGHVTRLQAIAAHLREPLWALSSLPAPPGCSLAWTQLARDDTPPPDRHVDVTARGVLHWAPPLHEGLAARMSQIAEWIAGQRPRLLVVDVSVEVALLARLCGVPTVVVALPGTRLDRAHKLAYDSAEALLAPWPDRVHAGHWPADWQAKLWCVGGISRFDERPLPPGPDPAGPEPADSDAAGPDAAGPGGGRILVLWGAGGRETSPAALAAARLATPGWTWVERDPVAAPSPDLWSELAAADVVITHAGQNAVAEVAAARRPAVVIAQPRPFGEQEATAAAVDGLGAAIGLPTWPAASQWPSLLDRARALGGEAWARWSTGDGALRAGQHLERLTGMPGTAGVA